MTKPNPLVPRSPQLHARRLKAEVRFKWYGRAALATGLLLLVMLLGLLLWRGLSGFAAVEIRLPVTFDAGLLEMQEGETLSDLTPGRFAPILTAALQRQFPGAPEDPSAQRQLQAMLGGGANLRVSEGLRAHPDWLNTTQHLWFSASSPVERTVKRGESPEDSGLREHQQRWLEELKAQDAVRVRFNTGFFTGGDSRQPDQAGFLGALIGSLLTVAVCLAVAFPLGVMTAVYLEEFAPRSRLVEIIEVNINNLAAVPSIVFGLLGLAVYLNFFGLPRSAPLVGGLTLSLMILPVIIISTRTALAAVPDSIRHGALALGASPLQVVWHHTLRLALPGIMTGTILGIARALGETAPLLMIGMVAFVADIPHGFTDPATVMPVQVYLWAGSPEAGFAEKTAAGIVVLLAVLLALNALAIYIRRRFEVRW